MVLVNGTAGGPSSEVSLTLDEVIKLAEKTTDWSELHKNFASLLGRLGDLDIVLNSGCMLVGAGAKYSVVVKYRKPDESVDQSTMLAEYTDKDSLAVKETFDKIQTICVKKKQAELDARHGPALEYARALLKDP